MKGNTVGEHISKMRGAKTQEDFAKELGVTQAAVSAWERNDKKRKPSVDVYFRLSNLADDQAEALYFLEMAGVKPQALVSIASRVLKDRLKPPVGSEVIAVRGKSARPLADGDVVVIDSSERDSDVLKPFWDGAILAELKGGEHYMPDGLYMGRLTLKLVQHNGVWLAQLGVPDPDFADFNVFIGTWRPPSGPRSDEEARERALAEMKVMPGWRVLGRVKAWIPA